jgi:hypothetical protein
MKKKKRATKLIEKHLKKAKNQLTLLSFSFYIILLGYNCWNVTMSYLSHATIYSK